MVEQRPGTLCRDPSPGGAFFLASSNSKMMHNNNFCIIR
jgi:hypothetical protein